MTAPEQMRAEYPSSQEEAVNASGWRFHSGGAWAADCDLIYYRLRHAPERVLGPTPPALLTWRWRAGDDRHCDIIAWLPVLAECQRTRPAPAELVEALEVAERELVARIRSGFAEQGFTDHQISEMVVSNPAVIKARTALRNAGAAS